MWHRAAQAIGALVALQAIQIPPPPRGFGTSTAVVQDAANVIPADVEERINRIAFDVHAKSGGEIAVVTMPSIGNRDESDVALRIGREWGVGSKGNPGDPARNRGVVILIVPKETSADGQGRFFISTGQGSEGFITDATAGRIRDEAMPYLRARQYGEAAELAALRVAERFASEFNFQLDTALRAPEATTPGYVPRAPATRPGFDPGLLIFGFIILLFLFGGLGGRRRRRSGCGGCIPIFLPFPGGGGYRGGGWGGGGFGGGFGGGGFGGGGGGGFGGFGGGGGFSGGGAGGRW